MAEEVKHLADGFVSGNVYDKYRTKNPIARYLMSGFLTGARELVAQAQPKDFLEVGCGPGDLADSLLGDNAAPYWGTDVSLEEIQTARKACPERTFFPASVYDLPFADNSFDCVIACEVFEHLDDVEQALAEVARVSSRYVLLSVPWEPTWRAMNMARGRYLKDLGNTPGHVQHFSRKAIRRLVASRFEIVDERHPLPWTMLLGRLRNE